MTVDVAVESDVLAILLAVTVVRCCCDRYVLAVVAATARWCCTCFTAVCLVSLFACGVMSCWYNWAQKIRKIKQTGCTVGVSLIMSFGSCHVSWIDLMLFVSRVCWIKWTWYMWFGLFACDFGPLACDYWMVCRLHWTCTNRQGIRSGRHRRKKKNVWVCIMVFK